EAFHKAHKQERGALLLEADALYKVKGIPTQAQKDRYAAIMDQLKDLRPHVTLGPSPGSSDILRVGAPSEEFAPIALGADKGGTFPASGWDPKYLREALGMFPRKARLHLQCDGDWSPLRITSPDAPDAIAIVMPVRL